MSAKIKLAEALARDPLRFERFKTGDGAPLFHSDPSRERLLRAGNQWGKSRSGSREALWLMTGEHPWREVKPPPVHGRVVTYSWAQSVVVQKRINELVPKFMVEGYDFNDSRGFVGQKIKLINGSSLQVMTASQDSIAHAGATLDFVWIDEPPPPGLYSELLARLLVRKGTMFLTMTTVGRPIDFLIEEVNEGRLSDHRFDLSVENCPHLDQEQIDDIAGKYLPHERPQRLHGHWTGEATDRYFSNFDDRCINAEMPKGEVGLGLGIDHGEGVGKESCILVAYQKTGDHPVMWILDTYTNTTKSSIEEDAEGILEMLERNKIRPREIDLAVGDVNSAGKASGGARVNDLLTAAIASKIGTYRPPFTIQPPRKGKGSVAWGCRLINYAFRRGDLTIHPRATDLINSFRYWQGADDDLKHAIDATRYILSAVLSYRRGYYKLRFKR